MKILYQLNGTQLACLQQASPVWKDYIEEELWNNVKISKRLTQYWGSYMPKCFIVTHSTTIESMKVTPGLILCGEEKTGNVVVYNRSAFYPLVPIGRKIIPQRCIESGEAGSTVSSLDCNEQFLVTGSTDGAVRLFLLHTGKLLTILCQSSTTVYSVKLNNYQVYASAGNKLSVHKISSDGGGGAELTHLLSEHTREVLCLDYGCGKLASGGTDKTIKIYSLGPPGVYKVLHTLVGHKLKVRCVAVHKDLVVSGSWDRTARIWDSKTGECIRILEHEKHIRCIAIDSWRILTGDTEGYVYAWSLENCLDTSIGPDKLCLRAHNAMDPSVWMKDSQKSVYAVHLEAAVQIQVAGATGRIVVSDFWDYDCKDFFQLESYFHNEKSSS
ncbi:F-box/WD repeat-containing protein lin-23 [Eurytemora carolleeae]|uniref:F-box/WD repeat-containing protein lin-23 n=1 Tax=Eurytemora carolleeae TaxID=1294199 RepID=UPI000C78BBB8|nr:F-box/WD repeat-containing protein lin-23 [Eurytemora carolleeae]|eukprot:XP_023327038.1 F-box/WD repeat-containing protein lin-23-like [Eurytemora affinis]